MKGGENIIKVKGKKITCKRLKPHFLFRGGGGDLEAQGEVSEI